VQQGISVKLLQLPTLAKLSGLSLDILKIIMGADTVSTRHAIGDEHAVKIARALSVPALWIKYGVTNSTLSLRTNLKTTQACQCIRVKRENGKNQALRHNEGSRCSGTANQVKATLTFVACWVMWWPQPALGYCFQHRVGILAKHVDVLMQ
jgi:hypothetical protein